MGVGGKKRMQNSPNVWSSPVIGFCNRPMAGFRFCVSAAAGERLILCADLKVMIFTDEDPKQDNSTALDVSSDRVASMRCSRTLSQCNRPLRLKARYRPVV